MEYSLMARISSPLFSGIFKFNLAYTSEPREFAQKFTHDLKEAVSTIPDAYFNSNNYNIDVTVPSEHDAVVFPFLEKAIEYMGSKGNIADSVQVAYTHDDYMKSGTSMKDELSKKCDVHRTDSYDHTLLEHLPNVLKPSLRYLLLDNLNVKKRAVTAILKESFRTEV